MWNNLPFDVLINIFSFLSADSLAIARSTCKNWNLCSKTCYTLTNHQAWFLALPIRNQKPCCYVQNPVLNIWYELSLEFLPFPSRAVSPIGSLLLLKISHYTTLQLAICNPFSRQFSCLPHLNISRTNPAVGVVILNHGVHL